MRIKKTSDVLSKLNDTSILIIHSGSEYENKLIPVISLRKEFVVAGEKPHNQRMVVVQENNKKAAIIVDKIEGEHQAVIKNLGFAFEDIEFLTGASMLGNGDLALVLDVSKLLKEVK